MQISPNAKSVLVLCHSLVFINYYNKFSFNKESMEYNYS